MTTTRNHPSLADHAATGGRGVAARIRALGGRLSGRLHAAADDRARARGWQVAETPGPFGLTGRSYRDPRFDSPRQAAQDAHAGTDGRHD